MKGRIVFGVYPHWTHFLQTGVHHYAREFAKNGYDVAFLSSMISPFHWLARKDRTSFADKMRLWIKGGERIRDKNVWHYTPFTILPFYNKPLLRNRWILDNSHRFTFPPVNQILKRNGLKNADIVWVDNVSQSYLLDLVGHKRSIFRIADDYYAESRSFKEKETALVHRVDLTIVPSRLLELKFAEAARGRVLYLPHGVDFEHFHYGCNDLPEEFTIIPSPRAIYVGTIAGFFDFELLEFAARTLPEVSFVLVGNPKSYTDISETSKLSNVFFLGARSYDVLPRYLRNADVGIVPFKLIRYTDPLIPIKLYEYMACGLPVVSMKFKEFAYFKTPAYLAQTCEDFVALIQRALDQKDKRKYVEFARANTWSDRYRILKTELDSDRP